MEALIPAGVMGSLGLLLSALLFVAARKFYVFEDPRIGEVEGLLPGANCGGCGKAGCKAFAEAVVSGEDGTCPAAGQEAMAKIARVLGKELAVGQPLVAHVMCEGLLSSAQFNGMYKGIQDCRAAHLVGQVDRVCSYGCVGLGTCVEACAFDAIDIYNHLARIIPENCVACGKCVEACPRELIVLIPKGRQVFVSCKSHDSGKVTVKVCDIGCMGCKKCVKVCPSEAITFTDNLSRIDCEKCTQCYECVVSCPRNIIKVRDLAEFIITEADLKQGFDSVAEAVWTQRAQEKAEAERKRQAELEAAGGEDPALAAKRAKIQKALDAARARAESDPEYAKKLPKIEAGFEAKLKALDPDSQAGEHDPAAPAKPRDGGEDRS